MLLRRCCPLWESRESLSIYWLTMWPLRDWRVLQTRSLRPQMSRFLQTWGPTSPSAAQRCTSTHQARQVRLDSVTDVLLHSVFDWGWFCTRQNGQKCPQNDKSVFNKWVKFMSRVPCRSSEGSSDCSAEVVGHGLLSFYLRCEVWRCGVHLPSLVSQCWLCCWIQWCYWKRYEFFILFYFVLLIQNVFVIVHVLL